MLDQRTLRDLGLVSPLSPYAKILTHFGLVDMGFDEVDSIRAAKSAASELAPELILRVERVVSSLMLDNQIRLFNNDPERAHLLLAVLFVSGFRRIAISART